MKNMNQLKQVLVFAALLLIIVRFVLRQRGNRAIADNLIWVSLPLLLVIGVLHFGPRFIPGMKQRPAGTGEKKENNR